MIKGDYDYLKDVASKYICSEHRTPVVVAWHATENSYVLRCGQGEYPEEVTRNPSLTQMFKQGTLPEGPIKDNIERRERRKAMAEERKPTALTLGGVPAVDLGTGELLLPEVVKSLVEYAYIYNLDPKLGHVVLMYNKPYITLDGYLYHANQTRTNYQLKSRPLEKHELKTYQIPEGSHAWHAEVNIDAGRRIFTGLGIVTREEMEAKSPRDPTKFRAPVVAAHPQLLAQKRAEWQVLRRAFPLEEIKEETNATGDNP